MTDQTTNGMFADHRVAHRRPVAEFQAYFLLIFLAALPLALLAWALASLRGGRLAERGPLARAWSQARVITPMIFVA